MGTESKIEWTDSTFNPWVGCTKIARPGKKPSACDFCYAEIWSKRSGQVKWGNSPRKRTTTNYWRTPLSWNARALNFQRIHGRRQRVFCASLADVFDNQADPRWRSDLFALIRECDHLDWQLLTKRPQNISKMLPPNWGTGYPNVWLGVTAEDASAYRQRARYLFKIPSVVHFVSYEPALGPIGTLEIDGHTPNWLIIGGESGVRADRARRTDPQWARDAILECKRVGAAPFLKQWGCYLNNPYVVEEGLATNDAMRLDPPSNGKGGGMLDGRLWREFPVLTSFVSAPIERAKSSAERRPIHAW
jgi:protein gp37